MRPLPLAHVACLRRAHRVRLKSAAGTRRYTGAMCGAARAGLCPGDGVEAVGVPAAIARSLTASLRHHVMP